MCGHDIHVVRALRILIVYWVLASVLLIIALTVPRLRPIAIAGGVVLGLMLGWGVLQRLRSHEPTELPARGSPMSPGSVVNPFPVDQLETTNLRLTGSAPFELQGHVANHSADMRLKSFTVRIARRDCYEGALDPSGCVVLWQGQQWVELALAPGEDREFSNPFWTRGDVPRVRGTVQDEIEVVAAEGEPVMR